MIHGLHLQQIHGEHLLVQVTSHRFDNLINLSDYLLININSHSRFQKKRGTPREHHNGIKRKEAKEQQERSC